MLAPNRLPPLTWLINDIPHSDKVIAKHIGIHIRTLQKYKKANNAPLVVYRALFWETRWGKSLLDSEMQYGLDVWRQYAKSLEIENENIKEKYRLFSGPEKLGLLDLYALREQLTVAGAGR